jgi:DNA invertase Pin-like site-specific DNA recombinase
VSVRPARKLRCAVYTRKSSEEGLEQEFNSLHAQREAGVAYIASQKSEGWIALPDHYDDGGISGGTLERPALKRLLRDVEAGLIDVVVAEQHRIVAKVDELMALCDRLEASLVETEADSCRLLEAVLHETLESATTALAAAE